MDILLVLSRGLVVGTQVERAESIKADGAVETKRVVSDGGDLLAVLIQSDELCAVVSNDALE